MSYMILVMFRAWYVVWVPLLNPPTVQKLANHCQSLPCPTHHSTDVYGHWIDINVVRPTAQNTCEVDFWYWYDGPEDASQVEASLADSATVQQEDVELCRAVQEGLQSQAYDVGRYAPEVEHPMFHFHRLLAEDVLNMGGA